MNVRKLVSMFVTLFCMGGVILAQEPSGSGQGTSLGDLARQQRAKSMKVLQERSVRVYTNENMPRRPAREGLTAAAGISATPTMPDTESTPSTEAGPSAESASSGDTHDEAYYRNRMSELRGRLELHQRQLAVLQQKQSQGQMQYYADPNKTLLQELSRSDINKLNDELTKKQQEIAADEQAIQELGDQLRREGHPPGWLR